MSTYSVNRRRRGKEEGRGFYIKELIPITVNENQEPVISGRALHEFLEVKERYNDWFPRMVEYGFTENVDFVSFTENTVKPQGGRPSTDHAIKLDMAKELSMIQRNEKGKQARGYFIRVEKEYNSPERIMARGLIIAQKTIEEKTEQITQLHTRIEEMRPKEIFADAVSVSGNTVLVGELAKILKQNGIDIGQNRLFEYLRENGYLIKRNGTDYNMPSQYSMELGLFEIKESTIMHSDGHTTISKTPKVTGKGQIYFVNHFKSKSA